MKIKGKKGYRAKLSNLKATHLILGSQSVVL